MFQIINLELPAKLCNFASQPERPLNNEKRTFETFENNSRALHCIVWISIFLPGENDFLS